MLNEFTRAYIECILWAETDDAAGEPLDANYGAEDFTLETMQSIIEDCRRFQEANRADLAQYGADELGGHDYWLTRNRHGAGYWDRDFLPHDARERLTQAAHNAGELSIYIGADGLLYLA